MSIFPPSPPPFDVGDEVKPKYNQSYNFKLIVSDVRYNTMHHEWDICISEIWRSAKHYIKKGSPVTKKTADKEVKKDFYIIYTHVDGHQEWHGPVGSIEAAKRDLDDLINDEAVDEDEDIKIIEAVSALKRKIIWE